MKNKEIIKKIIKEALSWILLVALVIFIKIFIFTPVRVKGVSMYPTLEHHDIMILNEIGYHLNGVKRFDIVVVNAHGEQLIKRIIGLPGETVSYKDNKLYINGEEIKEEFSHDITHNFTLDEISVEVIPEGYYFVVGDNRGNSIDSRIIGLISKKQILGKTNFVVFPFKRFGSVK